MRRVLSFFLLTAACIQAGCGVAARTDFPNALTAPDGAPILFDDVSDILSDPDLSEQEKREALRELGIEDERLIDALLQA